MEENFHKLIVHISGDDSPGILEKVTGLFGHWNVGILDIQQITILGQLSLVFLVCIEKEKLDSFQKEIDGLVQSLNIRIFCKKVNRKTFTISNRKYILTVLSDCCISNPALHSIAQVMERYKINIERINQMDSNSIKYIELLLNFFDKGVKVDTLKEDLFSLATKFCFDLGIQEERVYRKPKRLIVMDMDSTLIQQEVIDEIAKTCGVEKEVTEITKQAMEGKINFSESFQKRVNLLKGVQEKKLQFVLKNIVLTPGAERLIQVLKKNGFKIGIISGGFTYFTEHLKNTLQLDFHYANEIEIKGGCITGRIIGDIVDREKKAEILEDISKIENIPLEQMVAIGDGANDVDMLSKAGLGIAFHPKSYVKKQSQAFISNFSLDSALHILGIS